MKLAQLCCVVGVVVVTALSTLVANAQQPARPRTFAIQGARLATVSGGLIESGVIVIEDGLISAVGSTAEVPSGAWLIDGKGLTVYPGFIDALSGLGMPAAPRSSSETLSKGPEDRPATAPWRVAADELKAKQEDVRKWRDGGFTSAAAAPTGGIFRGLVSIVNLGEGRANEQVLRPRAALLVDLPDRPSGYRGYPASLLGRIAYVRQTFLDAQRYRTVTELYREDPRGLERPAYDRALEPIADALREGTPALYPADTAVQIRRAVKLAADLGSPLTVYGARQAYEAAEDLARAGLASLVNASWPKPPKDPDPEDEPSLRELRFRDRAPSSAAALVKAGVRFAFYAGEAKSPADFLTGVRTAVEAGLAEEAAVEALTLGAARIYGVDDRLGSLEPGKIANLVVFEGSPFKEKAKPKMVFVDGWLFEPSAAGEEEKKPDEK